MPYLKSDDPKRDQPFDLVVGQGTARNPNTGQKERIASIDLPDGEMLIFAMDEVANFIGCLGEGMRKEMAKAKRNRDN